MNRGSVALYLLFSITLSIAVGYGVYRVMHARRLAEASAAPARTTPSPERDARRAAVAPPPIEEAAIAPEPPVETPTGTSEAELRSIDPDLEGDETSARVLLGMPGIIGAMPRDSVQRHFRARSAPFQRCYEHFVDGKRGVIRVRFRIDTDGTLLDPKVAGFNAQFNDCVVALARSIKFSEPRDGKTVEVVYPIGFR